MEGQMPELRAVPRWLVERKPKHGKACNHCGLCCFESKCDIGKTLFGKEPRGPCPALKFDSEQHSHCDVIDNPQKYTAVDPDIARDAAKLLLYAGHGCTMRINGEWNDDFMLKLSAFDADNTDALHDAAALWGIRRPNMPF
jgi:hypothetical protein